MWRLPPLGLGKFNRFEALHFFPFGTSLGRVSCRFLNDCNFSRHKTARSAAGKAWEKIESESRVLVNGRFIFFL